MKAKLLSMTAGLLMGWQPDPGLGSTVGQANLTA